MTESNAIRGGAVSYGFDGEVIESLVVKGSNTWLLMWVFDQDADGSKTLNVRLTEDEARRVFERDRAREGILEPVRAHLTDREAAIFRVPRRLEGSAAQLRAREAPMAIIRIPALGSEADFLDLIDHTHLATPREQLRGLREELRRTRRKLLVARFKLFLLRLHIPVRIPDSDGADLPSELTRVAEFATRRERAIRDAEDFAATAVYATA